MDILILNEKWPDIPVLFTSAKDILTSVCSELSENIFYTEADFNPENDTIIIYRPAVCISANTLAELSSETIPVSLENGEERVAVYLPKGSVKSMNEECQLKIFYMPADEAYMADNAFNAYLCQEILKGRVNQNLLYDGVFIADIATAMISPLAVIEPGTVIMPNCQIYGNTHIHANAVIGPNSLIADSIIGANTKINNSQVYESTVGENTTVGPFSYIRPKSEIGNKVKIGDFVEIKKSVIDTGTKISHFAYIGDSEIGKNVNFSCGAITVNYDGKNKYKTKVGDNAFIGCNVNLVAPVEVGDGAFVAAGSTVVENVPEQALTVARARQYTKADWAKKRREEGKL